MVLPFKGEAYIAYQLARGRSRCPSGGRISGQETKVRTIVQHLGAQPSLHGLRRRGKRTRFVGLLEGGRRRSWQLAGSRESHGTNGRFSEVEGAAGKHVFVTGNPPTVFSLRSNEQGRTTASRSSACLPCRMARCPTPLVPTIYSATATSRLWATARHGRSTASERTAATTAASLVSDKKGNRLPVDMVFAYDGVEASLKGR